MTSTTVTFPPATSAPATTVTPTPSTTSPPLPDTSAGYPRAAYDAWANDNQAAAALVADPAAVDALFARTWSSADGWAFVRCQGAAGSVFCSWQRPGEELLILARNAPGAPVTGVQFRALP